MPGANEVLGCPRNYFVFLSKISDDVFLVVQLNFSHFSHQLSNFTRIRSLDAQPVLYHARSQHFKLLFWSFTYILKKTGPLDAPQGGCPGPSHRSHPPHSFKYQEMWTRQANFKNHS